MSLPTSYAHNRSRAACRCAELTDALTPCALAGLAMIGLFGFLSESQVPGSVPALSGLGIRPYEGNIMIPFEGNFAMFS